MLLERNVFSDTPLHNNPTVAFPGHRNAYEILAAPPRCCAQQKHQAINRFVRLCSDVHGGIINKKVGGRRRRVAMQLCEKHDTADGVQTCADAIKFSVYDSPSPGCTSHPSIAVPQVHDKLRIELKKSHAARLDTEIRCLSCVPPPHPSRLSCPRQSFATKQPPLTAFQSGVCSSVPTII